MELGSWFFYALTVAVNLAVLCNATQRERVIWVLGIIFAYMTKKKFFEKGGETE